MHTLIESRIVPFDGHALWYPARESMKVNTLSQKKQSCSKCLMENTSSSCIVFIHGPFATS